MEGIGHVSVFGEMREGEKGGRGEGSSGRERHTKKGDRPLAHQKSDTHAIFGFYYFDVSSSPSVHECPRARQRHHSFMHACIPAFLHPSSVHPLPCPLVPPVDDEPSEGQIGVPYRWLALSARIRKTEKG